MKSNLVTVLALVAATLTLTKQAVGQDADDASAFSLFGTVESDTRGNNDPSPSIRNLDANSEPEFTLVGTSRIGDRYSAILRNRNGEEVLVSANEGRNSRIEGYPQFSVVDIAPGRVSVQYPGGRPCVASTGAGVSCSGAANIASLELTYAEPVARRVPEDNRRARATERAQDFAGIEEGATQDEEEQENPFTQLRARALAEGANAPTPRNTPRGSFQPRRIDPADVPQGMRIVSTPFGDRLVED